MIFLRDNTEVLLIPRAAYIGGYQEALNDIHNLQIKYIDSSLSIFAHHPYPWTGPFCYILSENLLKYFGDEYGGSFKYSEEDFRTFIEYIKTAKNKNLQFNPSSMQYYGEVFNDFIGQLKQQKDLLEEEGVIIN